MNLSPPSSLCVYPRSSAAKYPTRFTSLRIGDGFRRGRAIAQLAAFTAVARSFIGKAWLLAALLGLPFLAGCEEFAYGYDYHGRLLNSDGSAARPEKVSIIGGSPFTFEEAGRVVDFRDKNLSKVDSGGYFSGSFNRGTYGQWIFLPTPTAPPLEGIRIWYFAKGQWRSIMRKLDEDSQRCHSPGGRVLQIGTVRLPKDGAADGSAE